ncbi:MAG: hypothetical protein L6R36_009557 [Xanthoria steineri]|nr:MAG: hypothetical protein L6R36_009557 [Xanthoria steineri]
MFIEMRSALNIPKSIDILQHIRDLSDEPDRVIRDGDGDERTSPRSRARDVVSSIERNAMFSQRPQPGMGALMDYLTRRNVRKGLCTRNFNEPVEHLLGKFLKGQVFGPVVTRETEGVAPKPSPEGVLLCGRVWALEEREDAKVTRGDREGESGSAYLGSSSKRHGEDGGEQLVDHDLGTRMIMVGDSFDDMAAGRHAAAATVLLVSEHNRHLVGHEYTDLSIRRLDDLVEILEEGMLGHREGNEDDKREGRGENTRSGRALS